jgi:transposase InsO family protein
MSRIGQKEDDHGYKFINGAPRHPQSQGKVERWNQFIGNAIASKYRENGSSEKFEWSKYVPLITSQYNFAKTTGNASPYNVRLHSLVNFSIYFIIDIIFSYHFLMHIFFLGINRRYWYCESIYQRAKGNARGFASGAACQPRFI